MKCAQWRRSRLTVNASWNKVQARASACGCFHATQRAYMRVRVCECVHARVCNAQACIRA
eukprot:6189294-Pleurochrysis_carterae.AAC.2